MKKILLLFPLAILGLSTGYSQSMEWPELMQDPEANLFNVQQSFEAYFANHPIEKGSGWKQFKRWEYYHSLRIDPQGNLRHPDSLLQEILDYEERRSGGKR